MTEPLSETAELYRKELFTEAAVEKFKRGDSDIEKGDLRHYNQLVTKFDDSAIRSALSKFRIPIQSQITVFGGFTGQFAESLRRIGMSTIFTDPMEEWVEQARKKGFESHRVPVQDMPRELVERTELFASFECYPDLIGESKFHYPMMRLLTVRFGILFAESKDTVASMREEDPEFPQELGTFRRWFRPLYRVYGIKRKAIKTQHLNFYHLFGEPETRKVLITDCRVMKALHDTYESDHRITTDDISTIAGGAKLDESLVRLSVERLRKLSDSIHAPFVKSLPFLVSQFEGSLQIGSKRLFLPPFAK
jgi:hypothetical protein